jgi:uncharacterized protein
MQLPHMMALGLFVFGLKTVPYQQLQRNSSWRYGKQQRVGARPARQFLGPEDDAITLNGTLYPELTGGKVSLALLRMMADGGKAWPLLEGSGAFYGLYIIESISETKSVFFADGEARRIDFDIKLARVDSGKLELMGAATSALLSMI